MNPSRFLSMIEDAPARAHAWNDMSEYARREAVQHNPEFLKYVHLSWERLPMNIKSGLSHLGESQVTEQAVCDNCHEPCSAYNEDPTLIYSAGGATCNDRPFRWGRDCKCGNRRTNTK